MADEPKKDDKKDAKPAEAKPKSALVPVLAAAVLLAGIGAGGAMYVVKALTPAPVEKPAAGSGEDGEPTAEGEAHGDAHGKGLLDAGKELDPIGLKGNVTGSGGTRYVTMQVGIWVPKADHAALNDPAVRRLIQARLEETVKTYQLEDLASPNILARMRKDYTTAVERLLRSVKPGRKPEDKFVLECTVTDLLTQ